MHSFLAFIPVLAAIRPVFAHRPELHHARFHHARDGSWTDAQPSGPTTSAASPPVYYSTPNVQPTETFPSGSTAPYTYTPTSEPYSSATPPGPLPNPYSSQSSPLNNPPWEHSSYSQPYGSHTWQHSPPVSYPTPPVGPEPTTPPPYTISPGPYPTTQPSYPTPPRPYPTSSSPSPSQCAYWMESIPHQGIAAFNPSPDTYQVFRNVKDFGAKGDGRTDDTAAIQRAISSGGRCGPGSCNSTTTSPAVVYFPVGTYMISSSIIDYYYTQLIGNPNCLPTIKASSRFNFNGSANPYMIDGDPYDSSGNLEFGATNIFWRQIRNFIIDMTLVPASRKTSGIHWPTGQATSITNVVFQMSQAKRNNQQGILIDSGSGGFLNDLIFNGGKYGGNFGNQQFTMRNLTFNNVQTAIFQSYSWGWVYHGITINNSTIGLNMYNGGPKAGAVGSITFIDSVINNTPVGFYTAHTSNSTPPTAGSLILENVALNNVPVAVRGGNNKTALAGTTGSTVIAGWGEGHEYTPKGPTNFEGSITPVQRPSSLLQADGSYYIQTKPQYQQYPVSSFLSARSAGATGDGSTDDTAALQQAIYTALQQDQILFIDHGDYVVTSTLYVPAGSRIVGETFSVIISSGTFFNDLNNPQVVVQLGKPGEQGYIEWSDMIVSTRAQQQGAILIQYNLIAPAGTPSGLWDVHTRVGGFAGSDLQLQDCPTTPKRNVTASNLARNCISGFLTMQVTSSSAGLYMENTWLWVADHDVENQLETQITVYTGRGLLIESTAGPIWLWGTAVEHHTLYQYSFVNAANVFAGFIQTETPYYQPNPSAPTPWPYVASYSDPQFPTSTRLRVGNLTIPNADAWGLRLINAQSVNIYGAGHYSFFNNYSTACVTQGGPEVCQTHIVDVEGDSSSSTIYNLNTVGTHYMLNVDGKNLAPFSQNLDGFIDTIALIRNL